MRASRITPSLVVFLASLLASLITLVAERSVGMNWDFHVDSVTYATSSKQIADTLTSWGPLYALNGGYYYVVAFLDENINYVITMNMLLFSATNGLLYFLHKNTTEYLGHNMSFLVFLFILMNPYRLHLSTTMLKDTMIIFFLALFFFVGKSKYKQIIVFVPLLLLRLASFVYLLIFVKRRHWKYFSVLLVFAVLIFPDAFLDRLEASRTVDLNARDFDTVPSFQNYGYAGTLLRALVWPLLALSGLFSLISPAPAFIMVSLGCVFNIIYVYIIYKRFPFYAEILIPMAVFAALAPGFTSYIRYVYPIITLAPFLLVSIVPKIGVHYRGRDPQKPEQVGAAGTPSGRGEQEARTSRRHS